ncbi:hypothetical protein ES703_63483 [subsurface metagenome]
MVALYENRALKPLLDGRCQDTGDIFRRLLLGIAHLGAGNFKDKGPDLVFQRGTEDGPRHLIGHAPDIYRRDGFVMISPPPGSLIQALDTRRIDTLTCCQFPNLPSAFLSDRLISAKNRLLHQAINSITG